MYIDRQSICVLFFVVSLLACGTANAQDRSGINELQRILSELGLKDNGVQARVIGLNSAELKRFFQRPLSRDGYKGKYRVIVDSQGQPEIAYGGGTVPNGTYGYPHIYRNDRWVPGTAEQDEHRINVFISKATGQMPPRNIGLVPSAKELTLASFQQVLNQAGVVQRDGSRIDLSAMKPVQIAALFRDGGVLRGDGAVCQIQIDKSNEITLFHTGLSPLGKATGSRATYQRGSWNDNFYERDSKGVGNTEEFLFHVVFAQQPGGTTPDVIDFQPVEMAASTDSLVKRYLAQYPGDANLIESTKLLSRDISKLSGEMGSVRAERDRAYRLSLQLFIIADARPDLQPQRQKAQNHELQLTAQYDRIYRQIQTVKEERSKLLNQIQTDWMRSYLLNFPSTSVPESYQAVLLKERLEKHPTDMNARIALARSKPEFWRDSELLDFVSETIRQSRQAAESRGTLGLRHAEILIESASHQIPWDGEKRNQLLLEAVKFAELALQDLGAQAQLPSSSLAAARCHKAISEAYAMMVKPPHIGWTDEMTKSVAAWHATRARELNK